MSRAWHARAGYSSVLPRTCRRVLPGCGGRQAPPSAVVPAPFRLASRCGAMDGRRRTGLGAGGTGATRDGAARPPGSRAARSARGMVMAAGWLVLRAELRTALAYLADPGPDRRGVRRGGRDGGGRCPPDRLGLPEPARLERRARPDPVTRSRAGRRTFGQFPLADAARLPQAAQSALLASYTVGEPRPTRSSSRPRQTRYPAGSGTASCWPGGWPTRHGPAR